MALTKVTSAVIKDSTITDSDIGSTLTSAISGSFTAASSSLSSRITTNASNMTLATASIAAITASLGQPVNTDSNVTFGTITSGDINSSGTITATEIHTTFVSSSIAIASGSNIFGDDTADSHQFTGSLNVSGSLFVKDGTLTVTDNVDFNGDLDVDGTTNLDAVDIDGNVDIAGTFTVSHGSDFGSFTSTLQYPILKLNSTYGSSAGNGYLDFQRDGTTASRIYQTSQELRFATGGTTDALTLDSSQDATFSSWISVAQGLIVNESGGDNDVRMESQNNDNMFRIDASTDRIGIGTASPAYPLDIVSTINNGAALAIRGDVDADGRFSGIQFGDNGSTSYSKGGIFYEGKDGYARGNLHFALEGGTGADNADLSDARMTITYGGNVGIGTTTTTSDSGFGTPVLRMAGSTHPAVVIKNTSSGGEGLMSCGDEVGLQFAMAGNANSTHNVIKFRTGTTNSNFNSSERMRITSDGKVGIGTTSPSDYSTSGDDFVVKGSDHTGISIVSPTNKTSNIMFADGTSGDAQYKGFIQYDHGNNLTDTMVIGTNGSEKIRIASNGITTISGNAGSGYIGVFQNDGNDTDRYGINIICGKDDGGGTNTAVRFADGDSTEVGKITFSGGTVTYGAFTAHHPCAIPDADNDSDSGDNAYPYGTLLETISLSYTQKNGADTERGIIYNVRKSQSANSKKVLGTYGSSMNNDENKNSHQALVLGDGHILCNNEGGNIKMGDGICTSSVEGIGMKATVSPSMVIGIAQEDVSFSGSETKLVAVQYGLQQFTPWVD